MHFQVRDTKKLQLQPLRILVFSFTGVLANAFVSTLIVFSSVLTIGLEIGIPVSVVNVQVQPCSYVLWLILS